MKIINKILSCLILTVPLITFDVSANDCMETKHKVGNCTFTFSEAVNGDSRTSKFGDENFEGIALSICENGVHSVKNSRCDYNPQREEGDCAGLKANTWIGKDSICEHGSIFEVIKNNQFYEVQSKEGFGSIKYECKNGLITIESNQCGFEKNEKDIKVGANFTNEIPDGFICKGTVRQNFYPYPSQQVTKEMCSNACTNSGYLANSASFITGLDMLGYDCACECSFSGDTTGGGSNGGGQSGSDCTYTCPVGQILSGQNCIETVSPTKSCPDEYITEELVGGPEIRRCIHSGGGYNSVLDTCRYTLRTCQTGSLIESIHDYQYNTSDPLSTNSCPNGYILSGGNCTKSTAATASNCGNCKGQMLGSPAQAILAGVPYLCENNVCYQNTCNINPSSYSNVCATCPLTPSSFLSNNGVSCNVSLAPIFSGDNKTQEFFNNDFNGHVSYFCMNGVSEVQSGTCYRNCKPQTVTWGSNSGTSYHLGLSKVGQCTGVINNKSNYVNAERSNVLPSTLNTGNSIFKCNGQTGNWLSDAEECFLDCPYVAYWFDTHNNITNEFDRSGRRKGWNASTTANTNMACSFNVSNAANRKHGQVITASSSGSNVGSATLRCNDGYWELQSGTCNLHCNHTIPSFTGTQGGRTCTFDSNSSFGVRGHNTTVNYVNSDFQNNGSITYRCNDGLWERESFTCAAKPCPAGQTLTWTGNGQTCQAVSGSSTEGNSASYTDSSYPATGGGTGTATFRCQGVSNDFNASWLLNSGSSCIRSWDGACLNDSSSADLCQPNQGPVIQVADTNEQWLWRCSGGGIGNNSGNCFKWKPAQCSGSFNGCTVGNTSGYTSSIASSTATWTCTNGSQSQNCSRGKDLGTNGVCGSSDNTCSVGTLANSQVTGGSLFYSCSEGTLVNGNQCLLTAGSETPCPPSYNYNTIAGRCERTISAPLYDTRTYSWNCLGSNQTHTNLAGSDASCSTGTPPPPPPPPPTNPVCGSSIGSCSVGSFSGWNTSESANTQGWNCTNSGITTSCTGTKVGNNNAGQCGSANGISSSSTPSANLCSSGTPSSVSDSGSSWDWMCYGDPATRTLNAGSSNSCSAPRSAGCGTASGTIRSTAPSSNLCASGSTASAVTTGTTAYTWTCTSGSVTANCSATRQAACSLIIGSCNVGSNSGFTSNINESTQTWNCVNGTSTDSCSANKVGAGSAGQCGSANNIPTASKPSSGLCSAGTATTVVDAGSSWTWSCSGQAATRTLNAGSPASCSANKPVSSNITLVYDYYFTYGIEEMSTKTVRPLMNGQELNIACPSCIVEFSFKNESDREFTVNYTGGYPSIETVYWSAYENYYPGYGYGFYLYPNPFGSSPSRTSTNKDIVFILKIINSGNTETFEVKLDGTYSWNCQQDNWGAC